MKDRDMRGLETVRVFLYLCKGRHSKGIAYERERELVGFFFFF